MGEQVVPTYDSRWFTYDDTHVTYEGTILGDITFLEASSELRTLAASTGMCTLAASTGMGSKAARAAPRINLAGRAGPMIMLEASVETFELTIPEVETTETVVVRSLELAASASRISKGASGAGLVRRATVTLQVAKGAMIAPVLTLDAEADGVIEGTGSP
jgi:hypothetical protein